MVKDDIEEFEDFELSEKDRLFCEEYVVHGNATKAAIACGYPLASAHGNGYALSRKEDIKAYIRWLRSRAEKAAGATLIGNAKKLVDIIHDENTGTKDRIKAIEVLNKMFGFNGVKKVEIEVTNNLDKMTDEQLMAEIERKRELRNQLA